MNNKKSGLEKLAEIRILWAKLPKPVREYKFHPDRKWRFDFAWPDAMLAVELEGGIWTGGAHTRGKHFVSDCEKYNAATKMGWKILRYTTSNMCNLTQDVADCLKIKIVAKEALST